jgi:hypothetical protein
MTNCCLICWLFLHFVVGLPWKKGCQQTLLVLFHLHITGPRNTPGLLNWNYMCLTDEVSGGLWVVNPVHVCCLKVPAHVYDRCCHSTGPQMFLVLFFCFLSGWVSSLSCLLISCCYLFIGSSLNSFQVDFNCTYGKSSVLLKVLSLPLDSGSILFKQSYDYGLCNDLSFHVGRFLEKEKLVSADFNQCYLLLLLPDPDPSWMPILQGLRNSKM